MAASGRLLAIGDVHGCLQALERLIAVVDPQPEDQLVFLGDYGDRGPDTKGVIDWLIAHQSRCRLTCLRGNHDQVMLDARTHSEVLAAWQTFGGEQALASYGVTVADDWVAAIPEAHWVFLESTPLYLETEHHILVHGAVDPDLSMPEQSPRTLMWHRFPDLQPHLSGKTVICGHTAQKTGEIGLRPHAVCIDTWVVHAWLTCLDVASGCYWQASQSTTDTRTGNIGQTVL